jgi:hypothetical protein
VEGLVEELILDRMILSFQAILLTVLDDKFKYGLSGKWMVDKKKTNYFVGGNRRSVETNRASLTTKRCFG